MSDLQIYLSIGVFAAVILAIAFDVIDMAVATLLGVSVLIGFDVLGEEDIIAAMKTAGGPLSLLFGGMVVARTLASTASSTASARPICAPRGEAAGGSCSCFLRWSPRCARSCRMPPR